MAIGRVAVGAASTGRHGYYTWPSLCFNAVLGPDLAYRGGTRNLLPGSRSLDTLDRYMLENGTQVGR